MMWVKATFYNSVRKQRFFPDSEAKVIFYGEIRRISDLSRQFYFSRILIYFQKYPWLMVDNSEMKPLNFSWLFLLRVRRKEDPFPLAGEIKDRWIIRTRELLNEKWINVFILSRFFFLHEYYSWYKLNWKLFIWGFKNLSVSDMFPLILSVFERLLLGQF